MEENSNEILNELIKIRKGLADLRFMSFILFAIIILSIAWTVITF